MRHGKGVILMVLSWIMRSLSLVIAQSSVSFDYAKDLWKDLHDRFGQGDLVIISDLQDEIFMLKGVSSVTEYFTKAKILWDELLNLRPTENGDCKCKRYQEEDRVTRFLKGLNEPFDIVKTQILMMESLPLLERCLL